MVGSLSLVGRPHSRNSGPAVHFVAGAIDHGNLVIANMRLYASTDVFCDAHSFVSRVRLSWWLGMLAHVGARITTRTPSRFHRTSSNWRMFIPDPPKLEGHTTDCDRFVKYNIANRPLKPPARKMISRMTRISPSDMTFSPLYAPRRIR